MKFDENMMRNVKRKAQIKADKLEDCHIEKALVQGF